MTPPSGWTWDRRWQTLARLMQDGEVVGEAALHNGVWTGRYLGSSINMAYSSREAAMAQIEEVARRME